MLAAKAKQQEDEILEYEERRKEENNLEDEIELYRTQAESLKEELKVRTWSFINESGNFNFTIFTRQETRNFLLLFHKVDECTQCVPIFKLQIEI